LGTATGSTSARPAAQHPPGRRTFHPVWNDTRSVRLPFLIASSGQREAMGERNGRELQDLCATLLPVDGD
jgi:hypothetical protein